MATATAPSPGRTAANRVHPARRRGTSPAAKKPTPPPLLHGREEGDFIVYDDVPLWTEHYSRAVGERFTEDDLHRIVARCNQRIEDTGDYALLTVRHTKDDPDDEPPPVVGMAGPFYVGTFGEKEPKAAIFAERFACYKEDREVVRRHPRVSVEYAYTKNDPKGGYFDVISLLGAEAPEMDLGLRYAKRFENNPDLRIGRYSRTFEFVDPETGTARYAADAAPGGSNTYVPGGIGGKGEKSGKPKKPKGDDQGGGSIQHAAHSKVSSGDGTKNTTSSATGTPDIIPQSQQGQPGQGAGSAGNGQSHGAPYQGQGATANYGAGGNGGAGMDAQRGSLSQVDIAQIVQAMQPSIEECVRRIIPAPQPPPVESEAPTGAPGGADAIDQGDGESAQYGGAEDGDDLGDDVDDADSLDADSGEDSADNDSPLADSDQDSDHAGGKDAGGRDATASANKSSDKSRPGKKSKKPPMKERFSMSTNANSNEPVEVARYKKQVADLTTERDAIAKERDELRVKYEKRDRDAQDSQKEIETLRGRVDAIDAERRRNARYSKLLQLQSQEGYTFELDKEIEDCAAMSDEEFAKHESRIRANYQRVPLNTLPMERPQHVGPRKDHATPEERARYVKQAQQKVVKAKREGQDMEFAAALREVYDEAGKDISAIPTGGAYAMA